MTIHDRTSADQTHTLSFDFEFAHSPAKVWRALTDPALLAEWLLPAVGFDLAPGTTFTFNTQPQPGWDGVVHCQMQQIDPQRTLRYTWVVGDMDTEVTFALTPTDAGTRLSLTHTGFKPTQKHNFGGARYGWKLMGNKLVDLLGRTA